MDAKAAEADAAAPPAAAAAAAPAAPVPAAPPAAAADNGAAAKPGAATVEQCRVLQQVIKLLEHTDEAKKMLPLANMTSEMLQTTLQVCDPERYV